MNAGAAKRRIAGHREPEFAERTHHGSAVGGTLLDEQIGILSRVGETEKDGAGLAYEKVSDAMALQDVPDLLSFVVTSTSCKRTATTPRGREILAPSTTPTMNAVRYRHCWIPDSSTSTPIGTRIAPTDSHTGTIAGIATV